jgi:PAS domain S-box-containing protein
MKPKSHFKHKASDSGDQFSFVDIFNLEDIQRLQDLFSDATGVASIITHPDGTPITRPSNFCRLCNDIIRKTEKGLANCFKSDAVLGYHNTTGPTVLPCLSGELWDAGASITMGGKHIANWLIGQVRNEELDEQRMIQYADEIGANREDFMKALAEVPVMPVEQFRKVSKMLYAFANELSVKAYNNLKLKTRDDARAKATVLLQESEERAQKQRNAIARIAMNEEIASGDMSGSFQQLTEEVANALQVERASIWLFSTDKSVMRCVSLYDSKEKKHSSGTVLLSTDYPRYFEAIKLESRISASDAMNDPRTNEFTEGYLAPIGIRSMLDAGIHAEGELLGVVCLEHLNTLRTWYPDEESFASTVASMVAQILSNIKRKQAEVALKESEIKYRELIENSPDAIAIYIDGIIILINKECLRLMAADHEGDLIGKPVMQFVHPDYRALVIERMNKAQSRGIALPLMNEKFVRLDGTVVDVEVKAMPTRIGNKPAVQLIVRDITERKQSEETISMLAHAIRSISECVSITDMNDKIVFVNSAFLKTYQYDEHELLGNSITMVRSPNNPPALVSEILPATMHGGWHGELMNRRKDGSEFPVFVSSTVIHDDNGEPLALIGVTTDITGRKQAENEILELNEKLEMRVRQRTMELEAANKELETFSYSVSHDLQAPLRHIIGFINLFLERKSTELTPEELGFLHKISGSANEMTNLINAILSFSRLNQTELRKTRIKSSGLVQQVIKFFEPDVQNRKITFNIEHLPDAQGDEELIRQVWTNLISNAIKYTGRKAEAVVDIGGESTEAGTTFYVRDNGAGFNMKYAERLFGVFQRLHKSRDFDGVGIGLANVNRIVRRHGGQCRGESEPEQGATFYFSLPK